MLNQNRVFHYLQQCTTQECLLKIKIQPFNQEKNDVLCYLSEFDAIAEGWTDNSKALQLGLLLIGKAREVSQQVLFGYNYLNTALLYRFGKQPAGCFQLPEEVKRQTGVTHSRLPSRTNLYLNRFIDEKYRVQKFRGEYY